MDSNSPLCTRNAINQKLYKGQNVGNAIDMISELPEALLHHILSLLPTKYAVRMSVLSKRWKYIWTSIYCLDFDEYLRSTSHQIHGDQSSFVKFVDRVMELCDVSNIQKFNLRCHESSSVRCVNSWVSAAIMHKVQELNLRIKARESFMLSSCLFTCESLTILKLEIDCDLDIPTSICFPSLKIMHLDSVHFTDEELTRQLFSSCPVLEELILHRCEWVNIKIVNISAPALKSLTISDWGDGYFDGIDECKVEVNAPNLVSFKYIGCVAEDYSLENLSTLFDAFIDPCYNDYEEHRHALINLLRGISKVKVLRMSIDTETVFFAEDYQNLLPTFHNLNHLELITYPNDYTGLMLWDLLRCLPNLEILVFDLNLDFSFDEDYDGLGWGSLGLQQEGLLPVLKELEFRDFDWSLYALKLVEYSLKNTKVLEKMTIVSSGELSPDAEEQILALECEFSLKMYSIGQDWGSLCVQDLLSHLKTVEIRNFNGNSLELELVKFFLKNAPVLEKMIMVSSSHLLADLKKQLDIRRKLLMYPKGSTSVILFS